MSGSFLDEAFQGLLKSTDGGTSWFAVNHGLSDLIGTESRICCPGP